VRIKAAPQEGSKEKAGSDEKVQRRREGSKGARVKRRQLARVR